MPKKHRPESDKAKTRRHTAANKIKKLTKLLARASGQAKLNIEERIRFWQSRG